VAGGRPFRNSGSFGLGQVPFSEAFARSCNTTFVLAAEQLPEGALTAAAEDMGFNVEYRVGVPAVRGSFPPPDSPQDLTSAAIGQGRVEASPLHMASVAAAAGSGTWNAPFLTPDLEGGEGESIELSEEAAELLPTVMRLAVTEGTGEAADIPNQDVRGKTGTAEFGNEDPLETHAWFIGFRGNLAFAVLVEGGGEEHVAVTGGAAAAPVARTFLDRVPDPDAQPIAPPEDLEAGTEADD
jgi:cell division protein FtsI/penicillin-binding protein 2